MHRTINYNKVYHHAFYIESRAHFIWILDGNCSFTVNSETFKVTSDSLLFIPAFVFYKIESSQLLTFISIPYESSHDNYAHIYIQLSANYKSHLVYYLVSNETEKQLSTKLIEDLKYNDDYKYSYFIANSKVEKRIFEVIKQLNYRYKERINISELAQSLFISSTYLATLFKKSTDTSISFYLQTLRFESTVDEILNTNKQLSSIAVDNGLADVRTLNTLFKLFFCVSPSDFRKSYYHDNNSLLISRTQEVFNSYYLEQNSSKKLTIELDLDLQVNYNIQQNIKNPFNCFAIGKASDLLLNTIQQQIHIANRELNFKYCTFHNVFGDDMNIITGDNNNYKIVLNSIIEILDFLISENITPIVELGYFPKQIASKKQGPFTGYILNTGGQINFKLWENLITEFFYHINNRYSNLENWYFSFFSAVDFKSFWPNSYSDLYKLYKITYDIAKEENPNIQIGGMGFTNITEGTLLIEEIIDNLYASNTKLDFISIHSYPYSVENNESYVQTKKLIDVKMNYKADRLVRDVEKLNSICEMYNIPTGIINEWNSVISRIDPLNDEIYKAASIIKNYILLNKSKKCCTSICYWVLSDYFTEHGLNKNEFHGGIGLLSYHGIKKPAYYAFQLINRVHGNIVKITNEYVITYTDNQLQLLVHNCNKTVGAENKILYKDISQFISQIDIKLITKHTDFNFFVTFYKIDINSSAKFWAQKTNTNAYITRESLTYLSEKAKIQEHSEILNSDQFKNLNICVEENEVILIEFKNID